MTTTTRVHQDRDFRSPKAQAIAAVWDKALAAEAPLYVKFEDAKQASAWRARAHSLRQAEREWFRRDDPAASSPWDVLEIRRVDARTLVIQRFVEPQISIKQPQEGGDSPASSGELLGTSGPVTSGAGASGFTTPYGPTDITKIDPGAIRDLDPMAELAAAGLKRS